MKRLLIVLVLVTTLSFTAFAEFRLGASLDLNTGWVETGIGLSVHGQYNFLSVVKDAIKVGAGATLQLPILDYADPNHAHLAIYASGMFYFLKLFDVSADLYAKLNLGFNLPLFDPLDSSGGFYNAWGIGYDFGNIYLEFMRASYAYDVGAGGWYTWDDYAWHLTIGFKI